MRPSRDHYWASITNPEYAKDKARDAARDARVAASYPRISGHRMSAAYQREAAKSYRERRKYEARASKLLGERWAVA